MSIHTLPDPSNFIGKYDEKNTHLILLKNSSGMQVALTDYGARIVSILVPDKDGVPTDVVLGFDSIQGYLTAQEKYHGAIIGRYANRIADGTITINEVEYTLEQNNGKNCLHGGSRGFHDRVWDRQVSFNRKVDFYYVSNDGEQGFPGNLNVHVSYELTQENELRIKYRAVTDQKTVINLTNHAYFNLHGEGNGSILDHVIQIPSERYFPIDENQLPIQETSVVNTPFDFREPVTLAQKLDEEDSQIKLAYGYDHTFITAGSLQEPVATARSEKSGIRLQVYSNQPSVHLYTANYLGGVDIGKSKTTHDAKAAFCFETQHYPNSPNRAEFPSTELEKGKEYRAETIYKFSILK